MNIDPPSWEMTEENEEKTACYIQMKLMHEVIKKAAAFGLDYGMHDGSHHKQWVIDQMLRILLDDKYKEIIDEINKDDIFPLWDEGIAP